MKRFLAIMLAILMMLTVFASCNKGDVVENATDEATDGETTIDGSTADVTDAPADGTDAPAAETDKPSTETDKPATETDKPATETDKPATETDKPATETDKPATETPAGTAPVLNGKTVTFGSFPQIKVTDEALIATIKSKGNTIEKDGTLYRTVEHEGKKYFGILTNTEDTGTWFEFAPLTWTVLAQNNGEYLVLCDKIIYAMAYDTESNDYENSDVRAWINGEFLQTAFASNQLSYILAKTVDNSAASTGYSNPTYYGNNTEDKVFLLSRPEVKNADYGFATDGVADSARSKAPTDYAKSKITYDFSVTDGNAWWWLRTPSTTATKSHKIKYDGALQSDEITNPLGGVLPAMWIKF